jgi:hypothetical protein
MPSAYDHTHSYLNDIFYVEIRVDAPVACEADRSYGVPIGRAAARLLQRRTCRVERDKFGSGAFLLPLHCLTLLKYS